MWSRWWGWADRLRLDALRRWLAGRRQRAALAGAAVLALALYGWAVAVSLQPARLVGPVVSLAAAGRPGVAVKIAYPAYLGPANVGQAARPLTVWARADTLATTAPDASAASTPVTLVVSPPGDALSLVDRSGAHVSGRISLTPGFPEWAPVDLWAVYGDTPAATRLFGSRLVEITPMAMTAEGAVALRELAFRVAVDGRARQAFRSLAKVWAVAFPVLVSVTLLALWAVARWQRRHRQVRLLTERQLAGRYVQLRAHIKMEQWEQARQEIDAIQTLQPDYRDVGRLDVMVNSAETAFWRREQLYSSGLEAYRQRQWPVAAQALTALEEESPYYREVRFLKRTAELYADLGSRDRSLRIAAAEQLGQVGDLVDVMPLIEALGDRSAAVAEAVERAIKQIGVQVADDLIAALRHPNATVRRRAFQLLQQMGRSIHDRLLAGLRSGDPLVTRGVARLLGHLGAREELAQALLWLDPAHHESIRRALAHEGVAAVQPLTQVLFEAPPERRQGIINVLSGLLDQEEVRLRVAELAHNTREPKRRALLQRALKGADQGSSTPEPSSVEESADAPPPETTNVAVRWLRRLDRGQ